MEGRLWDKKKKVSVGNENKKLFMTWPVTSEGVNETWKYYETTAYDSMLNENIPYHTWMTVPIILTMTAAVTIQLIYFLS